MLCAFLQGLNNLLLFDAALERRLFGELKEDVWEAFVGSLKSTMSEGL